MAWPSGTIPVTHLDADADSPLSARPAIKETVDQVNVIRDNGQPALLAGSSVQLFSVADATAATHAVNRQFGDGRYTPVAHNTAAAPHSGHALTSRTVTAGDGITGGGTLNANMTLTLGTPGTLTSATTNGVTASSHTHAVNVASTTVVGLVQLNNTISSTSTTLAATANAAKLAYDQAANNAGHTHTAAQIGTATAGLALGSVGSYAWLCSSGTNTSYLAGTTYAGSGLRYSGFSGSAISTGGTPSGTWRAMGQANANESVASATLFLRTV